jgi:hypothetical protein
MYKFELKNADDFQLIFDSLGLVKAERSEGLRANLRMQFQKEYARINKENLLKEAAKLSKEELLNLLESKKDE